MTQYHILWLFGGVWTHFCRFWNFSILVHHLSMACKLANLDFCDFGCFLEQIVISRCPFLGSKNRCNWSRKTFFSTFFGFLVNLSHFQFFWKKSLKKKNFIRFLDPKNVFFWNRVKRCILWKKMEHFTHFQKNTFSGLKNGRKFFFQTFFSKKLEMAYIYQKNKKSWKKSFSAPVTAVFRPQKWAPWDDHLPQKPSKMPNLGFISTCWGWPGCDKNRKNPKSPKMGSNTQKLS